MHNYNLEQFLMEERQRAFEAEVAKARLRREAQAARAGQPGAIRTALHYVGVALVHVGQRLEIQCRETLASNTPAA
jgi:hypothetical protein